MRKKIGIITFHCAENYGAYLQTYALQEWVKTHLPNTAELFIIDYRPDFLIDPYKITNRLKFFDSKANILSKCKSLIAFSVEVPNRLMKHFKFYKALNILNLSPERYSNDCFKLDDSYRGIILGSDQIWNTNLTKGVNRAYFGMVAGTNCIRSAYAASIGMTEFPYDVQKTVSEYLNKIDYIGVREKESVAILSNLCNNDVSINIDPTLLVNTDIWKKHIKPINKKDYILIYQLTDVSSIMEDAYKLAKKTGKKILHFGDPSIKRRFSDVIVKSISFAGPFDFISYIAAADIILTDSFHATCFSVIFKKQFFTYLHLKRSERLVSLAAIGNFEDRLIQYGENLNNKQIENTENKTKSNYLLNFNNFKTNSEKYLHKCLKTSLEGKF